MAEVIAYLNNKVVDYYNKFKDRGKARPETSDFMTTARERFKMASEAEAEMRREGLDDLRFLDGDQWDPEIVQMRSTQKRPCLVINRLKQFKHQVTNDARQMRPAITVAPVGDGADVNTAEGLQGIIRHIERNSVAAIAYDNAIDYTVMGGFGYFRIRTKYAGDLTFDQEISIEPLLDPFRVYYDPTCQYIDGSDAQFAFVVQDLLKTEYKRLYPKTEAVSRNDFSSLGDQSTQWFAGDKIRIAEYWYVDFVKKNLLMVQGGRTFYEEDLDKQAEDHGRKLGVPTATAKRALKSSVVDEREVSVREVHFCKINGIEILPGTDTVWASTYIPIIRVLGDCMFVNGKMKLAGLVRHAKDPQRMYNYMASAESEVIALQPKAPYVAEEGQIAGHEKEWKEANIITQAVLPYKGVAVDGHLVPAPQRQTFDAPIQAIAHARGMSADDLMQTMGMHDPSVGALSGERSGKAITALQQKGSIATFHFVDNLGRAMIYAGKQLLELIPKIYDRPGRIVRILGEDGKSQMMAVKQAASTMEGIKGIFDPEMGTYDVAVSMGTSYATRRQEAADTMTQLANNYPELVRVAGDLMFRFMDFPGSQEIADRLKLLLPPELQGQLDGQPQIPPQVKQQMQQLMQQHDALVNELNKVTEELKTKQMDNESKERIALLQGQVDLIVADLKANSANAQTLLNAELESINTKLTRRWALEDQLIASTESTTQQPATTPAAAQPPAAAPVLQMPQGGSQ